MRHIELEKYRSTIRVAAKRRTSQYFYFLSFCMQTSFRMWKWEVHGQYILLNFSSLSVFFEKMSLESIKNYLHLTDAEAEVEEP